MLPIQSNALEWCYEIKRKKTRCKKTHYYQTLKVWYNTKSLLLRSKAKEEAASSSKNACA